ncbi:hypothetical protein [Nostoc commune]|uniref:hypothetical protein n=1 Tax=Nostoc commune TaxID=1178 RepID=UPI002EDAF3A2
MSSDFQPPSKSLSILAAVGGVVTGLIAIAILNVWSKQVPKTSIEKPEISTSETAPVRLGHTSSATETMKLA